MNAALNPVIAEQSVAEQVASWLERIGVELVFGVSGGGIAPLWSALSTAPGLRLVHTQHESGAAFAATEASLATGAPVVVFSTTGPGVTNALTGLIAARQEGAKVLIFSGVTAADRRFRGATQESGPSSCLSMLFGPGSIFDDAAVIESPEMFGPVLRRMEEGLGRSGGFVGHVGLPTDLQGRRCEPLVAAPVRMHGSQVPHRVLEDLAKMLARRRVLLVAGFHARTAQSALVALAERLGAPVVVTPRAHGVFPASHRLYRGVVGFAGHAATEEALRAWQPEVVLVLGSGLGEGASQWCDSLSPSERLVWVHPTAELVSGPYDHVPTERMVADVDSTVRGLLGYLPAASSSQAEPPGRPEVQPAGASGAAGVSPACLMDAVQRVVVNGSDAMVMAEAGNSFAWAIHRLRFERPRLRISVGWGSMGHFTTGVVGTALCGRRSVALVGDGAMLMMNELATAAAHQLDATWVILNDSCLGMCRQGTALSGLPGVDTRLAEVDFGAYAASLGVASWVVQREEDLDDALRAAITGTGPRVVDVRIDVNIAAPIQRRIAALTWSADAESAP